MVTNYSLENPFLKRGLMRWRFSKKIHFGRNFEIFQNTVWIYHWMHSIVQLSSLICCTIHFFLSNHWEKERLRTNFARCLLECKQNKLKIVVCIVFLITVSIVLVKTKKIAFQMNINVGEIHNMSSDNSIINRSVFFRSK